MTQCVRIALTIYTNQPPCLLLGIRILINNQKHQPHKFSIENSQRFNLKICQFRYIGMY
ncbi:hypothetical protein FMO003_26530 [Moritella sp. F3]|nr:hypothetical protein FMO001_26660 [Moritella sp. F1]GIC82372.1 hypothetical protein FMO003_26530 [Moritella sp. F3]